MDRVLTADDFHGVAQHALRDQAFIVAAWLFVKAATLAATPEGSRVLAAKATDATRQAIRAGQLS